MSDPRIAGPQGSMLFALEGAVNGGGGAAGQFGAGPTTLPEEDPTPDAFCLPDTAGLGAPHWLPEQPFAFSSGANSLDNAQRRRIVLEGLVFRVREIVEGLLDEARASQTDVLLSGGLSADPFLPGGLAACLGRTITIVNEPESTLLGVARLASGRTTFPDPGGDAHKKAPGQPGAYLKTKFERWKTWMNDLLLGS
jgi:glycerol kinase